MTEPQLSLAPVVETELVDGEVVASAGAVAVAVVPLPLPAARPI